MINTSKLQGAKSTLESEPGNISNTAQKMLLSSNRPNPLQKPPRKASTRLKRHSDKGEDSRLHTAYWPVTEDDETSDKDGAEMLVAPEVIGTRSRKFFLRKLEKISCA